VARQAVGTMPALNFAQYQRATLPESDGPLFAAFKFERPATVNANGRALPRRPRSNPRQSRLARGTSNCDSPAPAGASPFCNQRPNRAGQLSIASCCFPEANKSVECPISKKHKDVYHLTARQSLAARRFNIAPNGRPYLRGEWLTGQLIVSNPSNKRGQLQSCSSRATAAPIASAEAGAPSHAQHRFARQPASEREHMT